MCLHWERIRYITSALVVTSLGVVVDGRIACGNRRRSCRVEGEICVGRPVKFVLPGSGEDVGLEGLGFVFTGTAWLKFERALPSRNSEDVAKPKRRVSCSAQECRW